MLLFILFIQAIYLNSSWLILSNSIKNPREGPICHFDIVQGELLKKKFYEQTEKQVKV